MTEWLPAGNILSQVPILYIPRRVPPSGPNKGAWIARERASGTSPEASAYPSLRFQKVEYVDEKVMHGQESKCSRKLNVEGRLWHGQPKIYSRAGCASLRLALYSLYIYYAHYRLLKVVAGVINTAPEVLQCPELPTMPQHVFMLVVFGGLCP